MSLTAGPALPAGALLGLLVVRRAAPAVPGRVLAAAALVGGAAAGVGRLDDLAHDEAKGLRGHLRALAAGRPSAGLAKLVVLPAAGVAAMRVLGPPASSGTWPGDLLDGALVAGAADLTNLLDVVPGRAVKGLLIATAPLAARRSAGAAVAAGLCGACAALLADDLAERAMLGDCGANAGGALAGLALVLCCPPAARRVCLAVVAAIVLLSEAVSLGEVIARVPPLAALDRWGRRGEDVAGTPVLP